MCTTECILFMNNTNSKKKVIENKNIYYLHCGSMFTV